MRIQEIGSTFKRGDWEFFVSYTVKGLIRVSGYTGSVSDVEIPSKFDGEPVNGIAPKFARNCISLTSVTIPGSVTTIGYNAFSDYTSLNTVNYTGSKEEWGKIKATPPHEGGFWL